MTLLINGIDLQDLKMEDVDGVKHIEREYTAYACVDDFNWMDEAASSEQHEQWEIPYSEESGLRGRLRLINNRRFTEAVKEKIAGDEGVYECEFDLTPDAFDMKKKACVNGYLKERFNFPITGTQRKWEVDVFQDQAGGRSKWIKIDLEYDNKADEIPEFPFAVKDLLISGPDSSVEVKEMINAIWEKEWRKLDKSHARGGKVN